MIIEFTGVPGVGKSFLLSNLTEVFTEEENIIFDVDSYILSRFGLRRIPFFRMFFVDIILIVKALGNYNEYLKLLQLSRRFLRKSSNTSFHKINILRNLLKKIGIRIILEKSNSDKIFFVDEGLTHLPFNILADGASDRMNVEEIEALFKYIPLPDLVVIVKTTPEIASKRFLGRGARGHRRINFANSTQVSNFKKQTQLIISTYEKELFPVFSKLIIDNLEANLQYNLVLIKERIIKYNV